MEEDKLNETNGIEQTGGLNGEDPANALDEEKKKAEEYLANWQRAQADLINYRRRTEKEKEEMGEYIRSAMASKLLPVLDDFDRAIAAEPGGTVDSSWVEGVKMVEKKLRSILEAEGLCRIECVGEEFDPYLHEAIREDCGEEGTVICEVQKGYKFNDKILRAAQVIVGNGEAANTRDE